MRAGHGGRPNMGLRPHLPSLIQRPRASDERMHLIGPRARMFAARSERRKITRGRSRMDHSMPIIAMITRQFAAEHLQPESIMGYTPTLVRRCRGDNRETFAMIRCVGHHYPEHMWHLSSIASRRSFRSTAFACLPGPLRRTSTAEVDAGRTPTALWRLCRALWPERSAAGFASPADLPPDAPRRHVTPARSSWDSRGINPL